MLYLDFSRAPPTNEPFREGELTYPMLTILALSISPFFLLPETSKKSPLPSGI